MHRWLEGYVTDCLREVSDGLEKGATLIENEMLEGSPTSELPTPSNPSIQSSHHGVEGDGRNALLDYYRVLPDLSAAATRAEFAVAEIWRTARRIKDSEGGDRAFAAICNATDRLRKLTGREKASLIGALSWLAARIFDISAAENDNVRADVANEVRDVVEHVRTSLELLRGQLDVGHTEGRLTQTIVDFMAKARQHEGTWDAILASARRAN